MGKDLLVILMVGFGLFAVFMFIMFFIYLKKYYNSRHTEEDYQKELDQKIFEEQNDVVEPPVLDVVTPQVKQVVEPVNIEPVQVPEVPVVEPVTVSLVDTPVTMEPMTATLVDTPPVVEPVSVDSDMEFVPIKKK